MSIIVFKLEKPKFIFTGRTGVRMGGMKVH
jgi:hypothetical protein